MLEYIAEGLPIKERELALAVQGQSYGPMFDEKLTVAAWKNKPTWALISTKDQMVPPAMQATAAEKMGAITTILSTCHMSILEEPARVTGVIDDAAKNVLNSDMPSRLVPPE
jgi:pimeloyl-ACP methyl ester carboxylesterase